MPKKRTGKALLIKPGSQAAIASSSSHHDHEATRASVNDLLRESRRLQLRDQSVSSSSSPVSASVPPQVRQVLDLPAPRAPRPRPQIFRPARNERGPSRIRTVPGPPPPKSWLIHSRHAPSSAAENVTRTLRRLETSSTLPGQSFPRPGSLQHYTLKELAVNWEWHADYDAAYLREIPTSLREALLSYIAVYNDDVERNPLRILFGTNVQSEDESVDLETRLEVKRLDLSGSIGSWTRLKQIEKDLVANATTVASNDDDVPDSWDVEDSLPISVQPGLRFGNLKHLSLALKHPPATSTTSASWQALLQLCTHLPTLESLSLAHWPYPTYTPVASRTYVRPSAAYGSVPVIYGGSNMYSAIDRDFREPAGILRSLSQKLHSLVWLDLTGCGEWWGALYWQPSIRSISPESDRDRLFLMPLLEEQENPSTGVDQTASDNFTEDILNTSRAGPDWNGAWRSLRRVVLKVGYVPVAATDGDAHHEMLLNREQRIWDDLKDRQKEAVGELRSIRRQANGAWIDFELEDSKVESLM